MEPTDLIDELPENYEIKKRHGCVTVWLWLMLIGNGITALVYLLGTASIAQRLPNNPSLMMLQLLGVIGIANVIFAVMLLKWKKWGYWGFIICSIITIIINVSMGLDNKYIFSGLLGIVILYGILQITENGVTAWDNLE